MPFFFQIDYLGWLRADSFEELVGLDTNMEGEFGDEEIKAEDSQALCQLNKARGESAVKGGCPSEDKSRVAREGYNHRDEASVDSEETPVQCSRYNAYIIFQHNKHIKTMF
jgi:hypothetical protein